VVRSAGAEHRLRARAIDEQDAVIAEGSDRFIAVAEIPRARERAATVAVRREHLPERPNRAGVVSLGRVGMNERRDERRARLAPIAAPRELGATRDPPRRVFRGRSSELLDGDAAHRRSPAAEREPRDGRALPSE
jgi:hypothetical protein